ncbi:hypothetical protein WCLP8_4060001 [uncultured Gammaproteobacteria bacterium]
MLGGNGTFTLAEIIDTNTNSPIKVSSLASGAVFSDTNTGQGKGIAITANAVVSTGKWQYSANGTSGWTDLGAVSATNAFLLDKDNYVRFVPVAGNSGAASLTFRGWDQFTGTAMTFANPGSGGAKTAYSATTATANLPVFVPNLPPMLGVALGLQPAVDSDTSGFGSRVVSADFNGDGKLDLAYSSSAANFVSVQLGNGDGTFQAKADFATGAGPQKVVTGDFNGDGKADLAVHNRSDNTVSVLLGNGNGTFRTKVDYSSGSSNYNMDIGDVNRDGAIDLVVSGYGIVYTLLGNPDGTFGSANTVNGMSDYRIYQFALADLNGDGKLDAVSDCSGNGYFYVALGNGDGTFQPKTSYTFGSNSNGETLRVGDINGDDRPDLVFGCGFNSYITVYYNNGSGSFGGPSLINVGVNNTTSVGIGDITGDGKNDLVIGSGTSTSIFTQIATGGNLQAGTTYSASAGTRSTSIILGDFNLDGQTDVLSVSTDPQIASVFLNRTVAFQAGSGTEDSVPQVGVQVSTLLDGTHGIYADGDKAGRDNNKTGVAITGSIGANGGGVWEYSLNSTDGVNGAWATLAGTSATSARVLDSANWVRFNPVAGKTGTAELQFKGWDQTDGAVVGATANALLGGSNSAYTKLVGRGVTTVSPTNYAPTDISISAASVQQSAGSGATVGSLTSTDANPGNTFTYTLVSGAGATDNAKFTVSGATLKFGNQALTPGAYSARIRTTDQGGKYYEEALSVTVIDDVAPAAPTGLSITPNTTGTPNNYINATTPTVSGTAEANATVKIYSGATLLGTTTANGAGVWSTTITTPAQGAYALSVRATDAATNTGVAAYTATYTFDTIAPTAPTNLALSSSSPGSGLTGTRTPVISGTAEAGSTVKLYDGATLLGTATAGASGVWSITSATLSDGAHTLTATATDPAGNTGTAGGPLAVTVDTTAPAGPPAPVLATASDSGDSNSDRITKINTPLITGTAEANSTVKLYDGVTLIATTTADGNGAWSITTPGMVDGSHTLSVTATDAVGNISARSATLALTIDTTVPTSPTLGLAAASDSGTSSTDRVTNVTTPVISGTADAYSTVKIYEGTTLLGAATATSGGTWQFTVPALNNGTHVLTATATDLAGNVSAISTGVAVVIDTVAPAAPATPTLISRSNGQGETNVVPTTIGGSAEAGSTIKLYDGAVLVATATADAAGSWAASPTLADGSHSLTVTATDLAGNTGAASNSLAVTIDTVAPNPAPTLALAATSDSGASNTDRLTNASAPVITGLAEAGSTVTLYDTNGTTVLGTTARCVQSPPLCRRQPPSH